MRVLHVIPSLDAQDGGPSVALPHMARALVNLGIQVDVATTMTAQDALAQRVEFGDPQQRDGYTVRFFKRQTTFYKVSLPLRSWLRQHARDYDLLHNHAVFSFAPLAAAGAARRARVPYIMRPLGLLNTWGMKNRRRWVKSLSFRCFDGPALDHAAAVHYTSDDEHEQAARLNLKSRAVVIPLGIDLEPFRSLPSAEIFISQFPAARERDIVLFLSRVTPKKGLDELLPAFAEIHARNPDVLLVIAGEGEDDYVASLKKACEDLGISRDVLWTGMIGGDLKFAAFAAAKLFVLPSHSENFGIALLEAMASGLPCVSTTGVALAREAAQSGAVKISAAASRELGAAMSSLLEDDAARQCVASAGFDLAGRNYSLSAMGSALMLFYRQLLNLN